MSKELRAQLTAMVKDEGGFSVSGGQFYFYGLCAKCQKLH